MSDSYNDYYQTKDLFGAPYPELINFFQQYPQKGKVLDLGCGQGRDAIPLARLGFEVTGIDSSQVGIEQMLKKARDEKLNVEGLIEDIYAFQKFEEYDFILLDSMFHFGKKERKKEIDFIKRIMSKVKKGAIIVFCIQDAGGKIQILNEIIDSNNKLERVYARSLVYKFEDKTTGHSSETDYKIIVVRI